ncbi:2-keto-3-deoxygluconate kinase [Listeria newyorkensis]|uniref:2-keto-3-deoxygluconate kinase n=2 Tax=Listeriaceae TaxID=186820 RepID=A0ABX4XPY4_9LIST|nr:2-keto-3-deoxygluconate kinase [Listeria newyorkensis]
MYPMKEGALRLCPQFERKAGGAELNFAIGCARLGVKPGWISKLGKDDFGRYILSFARGEGVDVTHVELVDGYATSVYFREVLSDGSSKSFYYRQNSPTEVLTEADFESAYFDGAKVLHITGVFPSIHRHNQDMVRYAVKLAKKHGLLISFDPNIRLKMWTMEEAKAFITTILPDVDILLTGEEEAEMLLGKMAVHDYIAAFHQYGVKQVVIKRGAEGAIGSDQQAIFDVPAVKPRAVVDTVGAGDGFDAGFISSLLKGQSFEQALNVANAVGSIVVSVKGDNEGLPYYEEVQAVLGELELVDR